jgi:hypothetical protein
VAERDALAKARRRAGDRAGAAAVAELRRPTVAAWAVNQLVRTQRADARRLAEAAGRLRGAQEAVLEGRGSAAELREAVEEERAAVAALTTTARGLLSEGGRGLTEAALEKVAATLHAVALDPQVAEAVLSGRLDREREAAGFGGLDVTAVAPAPRGGRRAAGRREAEPEAETAADAEAEAEAEARAAARRVAEDALARAREEREARERDARAARTERAAADEALAAAEDALAAARARARGAEAGAQAAEDDLERARQAEHEAARRLEEVR